MIEVAVGETGAEFGEFDAGLQRERAHAEDAEGGGTVFPEQGAQGREVVFCFGEGGDLDDGTEVGGFDHDLPEFIKRRRFVEVVIGDDERFLMFHCQTGNFFEQRTPVFDISGGALPERGIENGKPVGVGGGPVAAFVGEADGGG